MTASTPASHQHGGAPREAFQVYEIPFRAQRFPGPVNWYRNFERKLETHRASGLASRSTSPSPCSSLAMLSVWRNEAEAYTIKKICPL